MNTRSRIALLVTAALSTTALAQTAPSTSVPGRAAPVVTDVAPPPAEDRGSTGAVVLDSSPVRAQKEAQKDARKEGSKEAAREGSRAPTQIQGAGPLPPGAVRDALRGTGLDDPQPLRK